MKAAHEDWIAAEGMIPKMPSFTVATRSGLRASSRLPAITAEMMVELREQEVVIRNPNRVQLHNLRFDLILPEAIFTYGEVTKNAGTRLNANPKLTPWTVDSIQQSGTVVPHRRPTMVHKVDIPVVSALEVISFGFYTLDPHYKVIFDGPAPERPVDIDELHEENLITFFIEGTYQFVLRDEFVVATFFVPFRYQFKDRVISSLPPEENRENWTVSPTMLFPPVELKFE